AAERRARAVAHRHRRRQPRRALGAAADAHRGGAGSVTTPRGRVLLVGASGSIGRATAQALVAAGYSTVAIVRPSRELHLPDGVDVRQADVNDAASLAGDAF